MRRKKGFLKSFVERQADAAYASSIPADHWHFLASAGGMRLDSSGFSRRESSILHRLRHDRASYLRSTLERWGRTDSAVCERCVSGEEETAKHFLLRCPRWDVERGQELGAATGPDCLQFAPESVLGFVNRVTPQLE
jgi:hypothetical protein